MDENLADLDRDALIAEVRRLRGGIRKHRDSTGHELCWHHPELWGLLPQTSDPVPAVPAWPEFLRGCVMYRESLDRQLPEAPRTHVDFAETEANRIADELNRSVEGDPWHGDPVSAILAQVTVRTAAARARPEVHSIWEIVRHMTAWTNEMARRLDGHPAREPEEGDWPAPSGPTEQDWSHDVSRLLEAHRRLVENTAALSDDRLQAPPAGGRDRPAGSGVTLYVQLHGLAQHHAYHAGQMALLKKLVSSG